MRACGHFDISLCNFPEASANLNLNAGPGKTTGVEGNSGKKYLNCNYLYIVMYKNDFKCQHLQVIHNVIVLIPFFFFFFFGLSDEGYMIIIVIAGVVLALSVAAVVSKYSTFP